MVTEQMNNEHWN